MSDTHACDNCMGIDPDSCLFNGTKDPEPCCECGGDFFTCICDESVPPVPAPVEAEGWPLRYRWAEEIKAGDYLIVMGDFQKVDRVNTFEPYASIQIVARGKEGVINYARTSRHRPYDSFWVLVSPA
jgi:hypothetical protein